jgi:hypothetical protein
MINYKDHFKIKFKTKITPKMNAKYRNDLLYDAEITSKIFKVRLKIDQNIRDNLILRKECL